MKRAPFIANHRESSLFAVHIELISYVNKRFIKQTESQDLLMEVFLRARHGNVEVRHVFWCRKVVIFMDDINYIFVSVIT